MEPSRERPRSPRFAFPPFVPAFYSSVIPLPLRCHSDAGRNPHFGPTLRPAFVSNLKFEIVIRPNSPDQASLTPQHELRTEASGT